MPAEVRWASGHKIRAGVRRPAPDGSVRTGRAPVGTAQAETGAVVWQDSHGALSAAPAESWSPGTTGRMYTEVLFASRA